MKIELLSHTQDPEMTICLAIKLCYSESGLNDLRNGMDETTMQELIKKAKSVNHESVFEHATFTFGIDNISNVCCQQLMRHRIASFSQQSLKNSKSKKVKYALPKNLRDDAEIRNIFDALNLKFSNLISDGFNIEDVKYILPICTSSRIIMTMNVRELYYFFNLRLGRKCQKEIRLLAREMLKLLNAKCPLLFNEEYNMYIKAKN